MAERPQPSFLLIVQLHHLQAMLKLGQLPNPMTGTPDRPDYIAARHELALLEILREKTSGNLTEEESRLLDEVIGSLQAAMEG